MRPNPDGWLLVAAVLVSGILVSVWLGFLVGIGIKVAQWVS